jgi:hypothetical protein
MASFCWRDQDEIVVPVNVLLLALFVDFQIVDIFVTSLRLAQLSGGKQGWCQSAGH